MNETINKFKNRLNEFSNTKEYELNQSVKIGVSICYIVIGLVELGIYDNRKLQPEEIIWFESGTYLARVFDIGTRWEDLEIGYHQMVRLAKGNNLF